MLHPPTVDTPGQFDEFRFRRRMKKLGKAYRNRAIELIAICRLFSQAAEQGFMQDADLTEVLQACDRALSRAVEARDGSSRASDESIELAIRALKEYESKYHSLNASSTNSVRIRMNGAQQRDGGRSTRAKVNNILGIGTRTNTASLGVVEFHFMESLTSTQPIIVRQEITNDLKVQEILWNFSRCDENHFTLAKNPHFYRFLPHTSPNATGNEFTLPIEDNWHANPIYVLTNIPGRIFLECDRYPRAFDNVWEINGILVFKGICGRIGSETIVGEYIQGRPCFWCIVESPPSRPWEQLQDWREAILTLLTHESRDIKIRIAEHNT